MNPAKERWLILGASCLVNLCIGSLYAWSVFASPMAEYLSGVTGRTITHLSVVFTVANTIGPVPMILSGFINDRLGPKLMIRGGGLLFGCGMFSSGFVNSPGMLVITYGLCLGFGTSMIYSCTISNSVKFFPDRRGLAGGLATASYGISSVIVPPIANALITIFGVTATFKILGATMFLIIYAASFFIRQSPPVLTPEGRRPAVSAVKNNADKNWKGILADPVFYVMLLLLCCGAFSGLMVISQASLIAQGMIGMSAAASAAAVSALALFNTCGRIAAGAVSDKLGVVRTLAGIFIVSIIGLIILLMIGTGDVIQFYAGVLFVGFAFGSIMGMFPGFTAQQFGYRNNSVNYGIMFTGFAASGFFGPTIMSAVYTQTGSYKPAFLTAICLAAAGMLLSIVYAVSAASRRRNITG